jgi:hypothetical protein
VNNEDKDGLKKPVSTMRVHFIYRSTLASGHDEPKLYAAAMNGNDSEKWTPATKININNLIK